MPLITQTQYQALVEKCQRLEAENEALWEELLELREDLLAEELTQLLDHQLQEIDRAVLPVSPLSLLRH